MRKSWLHSGVMMLALASAGPLHAAPQRVMSINLCSDQLVLDLLPPERIASVSYMAREGYGSYLAEKASHVAVNHGTAEEALAHKPDLLIGGQFSAATTSTTKALLKKIGVPVLELPAAENFETIRANTRLVGKALGEEEKAEALIREMDATLAELAATAPKQRIVIAGWDGSGSVPGPDTLFGSILKAAGAVNVASSGGSGYVKFDLEQLLVAHPDLLAFGDSYSATPSIRTEGLMHPALRQRYAGREFTYPELLYACGLPQTAGAAKLLRETMLKLLAAAPSSSKP